MKMKTTLDVPSSNSTMDSNRGVHLIIRFDEDVMYEMRYNSVLFGHQMIQDYRTGLDTEDPN